MHRGKHVFIHFQHVLPFLAMLVLKVHPWLRKNNLLEAALESNWDHSEMICLKNHHYSTTQHYSKTTWLANKTVFPQVLQISNFKQPTSRDMVHLKTRMENIWKVSTSNTSIFEGSQFSTALAKCRAQTSSINITLRNWQECRFSGSPSALFS